MAFLITSHPDYSHIALMTTTTIRKRYLMPENEHRREIEGLAWNRIPTTGSTRRQLKDM